MLDKRTNEELARLLALLSLLLQSGVPLVDGLDALSSDAEDPRLGETFRLLRAEIMDGAQLSEAVELFPEVFTPELRVIFRAGASKGSMAEAAGFAAENLGTHAQPAAPVEGVDPLAATLEEFVRRLGEGTRLSALLSEQSDRVPEPLPDLLTKAEDRGVVDMVLRELAQGLRSGSLPPYSLPAAALSAELRRLFYLLAVYLDAGLPRGESLAAIAESLDRADLRAQVQAMAQSHGSIASVMYDHPDVYPHTLCMLVDRIEANGEAAASLKLIAEGIAQGLFLPKEYH